MDRIFRVDFYPQDWIASATRMEMDERSIFIQILALIYCERGPINDDAQWIAGLSKCSARLARKVINKLVDKSFLQRTENGKLIQKRAESELRMARERFENSSKGGRKKAENECESNKNKDIVSSDPPLPLATPSASTSHQRCINIKHLSVTAPRDASLPEEDLSKISVEGWNGIREKLISKDFEAVRRIAPGWDIQRLVEIYDSSVRSGERPVPRSAGKHFVGFCKRYTKGKSL